MTTEHTVYLPLITLAVWAQLSLSIYQEIRVKRMAQAALHALETTPRWTP